MALTIALQGGAAFQSAHAAAAAASVTAQSPQSVYNEFERLVKSPSTLGRAVSYLINHIDEVTAYQATVMTLHLENAQKLYINKLAERFYAGKIQMNIDAAYRAKGGTYSGLLSAVKDSATRKVLTDARDTGFKVETSEGMYYPEINYAVYQSFKAYVTKDIQAYITIMTAESNKRALNDAAIVVGWDEIAKRALRQEAFLYSYPSSNRKAAVLNLYRNYKMTVFYGSNNTPLFDYDTLKFKAEALTAYKAILDDKNIPNTGLKQKLQLFVDVVEKNNGKRTAEVDGWLKEQVAVSS
ncbi:hypothetical protein VN24_08820 [Paenibacillus beijingensis]|uniref:Uncharacterized protein n=1 Tax=Paenibacillus beijingensis TaxID=1126833 RepID=A0A0D5NQQ2_9BACL|nr:hypothetical protein VN24_08820 [Paenibacillus beijingensis]